MTGKRGPAIAGAKPPVALLAAAAPARAFRADHPEPFGAIALIEERHISS
jgi:hypothetical protein